MKLALVAASVLALSSPAFADDSAPVVHVEKEVGTRVFVERLDPRPDIVCEAPCDETLAAQGVYRLRSDSFRTTNVFRIPPDRKVDIRIASRANGGFVASIVLMTLSGAFATAAGFLFAWAVVDDKTDARTFGIGIGVPMAAVSLGLGIPGAAMLFSNFESRARVFTAPIVSGTF